MEKNPKELHPVVKEFRDLIQDDTRLYLLFTSMFDQIPKNKRKPGGYTGELVIKNYQDMLRFLNHYLTEAPAWSNYAWQNGFVGVPFSALFDGTMATESGFAVFLDPKVNAMLKKILDAWGEFLTSPPSAAVLNNGETGWFGRVGMNALEDHANVGKTSRRFHESYVCDERAEHYGFTSWDAFFTRAFRVGVRPVARPEDDDCIVNACESMPYNTSRNIQLRSRFWLKSEQYSLYDMLHDPLAVRFIGGTVYQAYLDQCSYHRWHSPVRGTIVKTSLIGGVYFSQPPWEDVTDIGGGVVNDLVDCQEYLAATSTRAVVFIEADNPAIGLMVFIGIGMAEVSTCETTVKVGEHVEKGQELGMFHFGGSTYVLLFREGVDVHGFPKSAHREYNVPVNSELARVGSSQKSDLGGEDDWEFVLSDEEE